MLVAFLSLFAFVFFGMEHHAFAWGTGAHIDFVLIILSNTALIAPAVRVPIKRLPMHFLDETLSADVVAANSTAYLYTLHHQW